MVSETKIRQLEEIKQIVSSNKIIGLIELQGKESVYVKQFRKELRDIAETKFVKKRILKKAIEELKEKFKGLENLENYLCSQNLVIASNKNFNELIKKLKSIKIECYAKPGQIAPKDIVIPKGPTPFTQGVMLGELKRYGLKVRMDPKLKRIVVDEDKVIVKQGEEISQDIAALLQKFDIKPIEITFVPEAVYVDGIVISKELLLKEKEDWIKETKECIENAKNLALALGILTDLTAKLIILKSYLNAHYLSLALNYYTKDNIKLILGKAIRIAGYLQEKLLNK